MTGLVFDLKARHIDNAFHSFEQRQTDTIRGGKSRQKTCERDCGQNARFWSPPRGVLEWVISSKETASKGGQRRLSAGDYSLYSLLRSGRSAVRQDTHTVRLEDWERKDTFEGSGCDTFLSPPPHLHTLSSFPRFASARPGLTPFLSQHQKNTQRIENRVGKKLVSYHTAGVKERFQVWKARCSKQRRWYLERRDCTC